MRAATRKQVVNFREINERIFRRGIKDRSQTQFAEVNLGRLVTYLCGDTADQFLARVS